MGLSFTSLQYLVMKLQLEFLRNLSQTKLETANLWNICMCSVIFLEFCIFQVTHKIKLNMKTMDFFTPVQNQ